MPILSVRPFPRGVDSAVNCVGQLIPLRVPIAGLYIYEGSNSSSSQHGLQFTVEFVCMYVLAYVLCASIRICTAVFPALGACI